jgi:hypothetical protein
MASMRVRSHRTASSSGTGVTAGPLTNQVGREFRGTMEHDPAWEFRCYGVICSWLTMMLPGRTD